MTERDARRARRLLTPMVEEPRTDIVDLAYSIGQGRRTGVMVELRRHGVVLRRFYRFDEVEAARAQWNERQESLGKSPIWQ